MGPIEPIESRTRLPIVQPPLAKARPMPHRLRLSLRKSNEISLKRVIGDKFFAIDSNLP